MAAFKLTALFEYLSGSDVNVVRRKAGWSESVYWTDASSQTLNSFRTYLQSRATLLPANTAIVGGRVQQVDPTGVSQTFVARFFGSNATAFRPDIPQMALLVRARASGATNIRSMRLAAIPDAMVVNGELAVNSTYYTYLLAYLRSLSGWRMRGQDLTMPRLLLASVTALGVYTTNQDLAVAVGDKVRIYNARTAAGVLVEGPFVVESVTSLRSGTLRGWTGGLVTGGQIRKVVYVYPPIVANENDVGRIVTRKVGRPFTGYVGRQRRRKR